jgi:opacity protein-like surface antigen
MVKQIFGAKSAPASESAHRRSPPAIRIGAVLGGFAAGLALTAAPAAAQCVGGTSSVANALTPFASGGAVNTLVSAINASNTAFLTQSTAFIGSPPNPDPDQLGGGVWARGIGGQTDFKSTSTASANTTATLTLNLPGIPPLSASASTSGNLRCDTTTKLNFAGVQIGTDVAQLNVDGWNLHGGSTLGYVGTEANDFATGGSFQDNLQIPFVGLYGAATKGGFFVDGQAKWSYYQNTIADSSNGLFGQNLDARGFSVNGNIGYNYGLPGNWFIEPSAGFLWSKVSVDPLNTSGTFVLGTGVALPGTVDINSIYSALGRVSLRVGTSLDAGGLILQPFATISGFREFQGNNSATITSNNTLIFSPFSLQLQSSGQLSATNIGNYGQFGLGVVAILPNTGWLAYVRGDYRTGDHIDGWNMNVGLRYQLNPDHPVVTGRSADVPGAPLTVAAYNWTGFYLGPSLGADWGYTNWTFLVNGSKTYPRFAGILPGGQVGYNYQYGKWVFGVEGDAGWTNAHGSRACPSGFFFNCEINVNSLYTVTGRIGYVWPDRVLWYAKGGLAVGEVQAQARCNTDSQHLSPLFGGGLLNPGCPVQGTTRTDAGWTIGGGSELALTDNWSVKAETSYFNLGTGHYTQGPNFDASGLGLNVSRSGWIANIGLNYRFTGFGEGPAIVAKY